MSLLFNEKQARQIDILAIRLFLAVFDEKEVSQISNLSQLYKIDEPTQR